MVEKLSDDRFSNREFVPERHKFFSSQDKIWDFVRVPQRKRFGMEEDMKHIKTLSTRNLQESMKKGGCGECQTSCQSACKTSCTVGNQSCEKVNR